MAFTPLRTLQQWMGHRDFKIGDMAEKNESELLEEVAGRLNEIAQYLSQINQKLEDINEKLAWIIEKSD